MSCCFNWGLGPKVMTLDSQHAKRASERYVEELEKVRSGRVTMAELCDLLSTGPKTVRKHMGAGLIKGELMQVYGKPTWLFEREQIAEYDKKRHAFVTANTQAARSARGGAKLAVPPPGYTSLIEIARDTGHSIDYMRGVAKRSGVPLERGPKLLLMVRNEDAPSIRELAMQAKPRPSRQRAGTAGDPIEWTPSMDAMLGLESDSLVAGKLGVSPGAVRMRRSALGIAPATPAVDAFAWRQDYDALFSVRPDHVIAEITGASLSQVRRRRRALGVPPFRSGRGWTAEAFEALGKMTDARIAAMLGVSAMQVYGMRKRLGIAKFMKGSTMKKTENLSPELREKIERARPAMLQKLKDAGFGFTEVTDEQIIAAALDLLIAKSEDKH